MDFLSDHFERVQIAVTETFDLASVPGWLCKHTKLAGKPFSFKDHEFQERILLDTSRVLNVQKCSQVGLSEIFARYSLAVCNILPAFTTIITFPYSGDSENFARTRVDPIVAKSEKMLENLNTKLNSSKVKQFGESFLYFRGTQGETQAISIPADMILSDEIDRSDPDTLTQYTSRLTHSRWKLRRNFSTPTIPGWGIALEMETSRRFKDLCKCSHCNNWFLPDYYEHVKIPGFNGDLRELTKSNIQRVRHLEAALHCPRCGEIPDLSPAHRRWVQENTADNYEAAGYYVSPFSATGFITTPYLVKTSTEYKRRSEFDNQNLGLTSDDANESLRQEDLLAAKVLGLEDSSVMCAMGIDVGLTCHITVGRTAPGAIVHPDGLKADGVLVVHRETCLVGELEKRKAILKRQYRVGITVIDSLPYTDTVARMQAIDKSLFGAIYHDSKNAATYNIRMFEGDPAEGKMPIHTAQIKREEAFDVVLGLFKRREIKIAMQEDYIEEQFDKHCLDMKRVPHYDKMGETTYRWMKSKIGDDHFMHSLGYMVAAVKLRGVVFASTPVLSAGVTPFQVRKLQRKVVEASLGAPDWYRKK